MNISHLPNRKIVMLTITEHCNLDCVYCYEKFKTKNVMSLDMAKNIIAFEVENSNDFNEIEIDLFGGEPTLRKGFIKEIVKWIQNKDFQKQILIYIDTNGTLVKGTFKKWLIENKKIVKIGLSLDGTPETHNKNRGNSYNDIDIDFFVKNYPNQSVRMTINNMTVSNLSNDIIHLHNLGFLDIIATFANGINWDFEKIKVDLTRELRTLVDFYVENPHLKVCSIFDMELTNIINNATPLSKWCGSGTNMISYTFDGKSYPCHIFQPNTTGSFDPVHIDYNSVLDYSDIECSGCPIERICQNCSGLNLHERNDILSKDKKMCKITKTRAFATSYLLSKQIENNTKQFEPSELYQIIEAIEIIHSKLLI